jgi:hypothetical protein
MSRSICVSVSVDIDRFGDGYLRSVYAPMFARSGLPCSPDAIRHACREMRAKGFACFPSCAHAGPDGGCMGVELAGPDDAAIADEIARMRGEP